MDRNKAKFVRRKRRKRGIRKLVNGTAERPRLTVFRSEKHIYAQVVNDLTGKTLVAASSIQLKKAGGNVSVATEVGKTVAEQAKAAGINEVAFDRNGFRYHGRIKALADAAREGGLKF